MRNLFTAIILFCSFLVFPQENIKKVSLKINKKSDVFQVVEEEKNQIIYFFNDSKRVTSVKFNEALDVIDSISTERPNYNFEDIVGYSIKDNRYYTYWSKSKNKEMIVQCFDFDTKKVTNQDQSIVFDKEKEIKKITVNNVFYIITIGKQNNALNFYCFNDGKFEKKSIDISELKFLSYSFEQIDFYKLVTTLSALEPSITIQDISNETPSSLVFSACKRKIYTKNNTLTFAFDINKTMTQTITINLTDFTFSQKNYEQPYIEREEFDNTESNSFLLDNGIVQIHLDSGKMYLSFKDLEGNEVKNYKVYAEKEIVFKNSDILQENGSVRNTRVLDNSSQLLRKFSNLYPAISCYTNGDQNYITLGAVSPPQNNGMMYGAMIGGLSGALIGAAISSNYSVNNINSYNGRKVVYINCLFDKEFNHINGDIKKLAFDDMRAFIEENNTLTSKSVFKYKSSLYYTGFDKDKNYNFYKFDNK